MSEPNRGYACIPNDIIRGGHGAYKVAVLCAVVSHGRCTASASTLARETGCHERTVRRSLKYWAEYAGKTGLLIWEQKKRTGSTFVIQVLFPGLPVRTGSDRGAGGIGMATRSPRTQEPTKKNPEEEQMKKGEEPPWIETDGGPGKPKKILTSEEAREASIRTLRAAIERRPDIMREPLGQQMLKQRGLTPNDLWPSKNGVNPSS